MDEVGDKIGDLRAHLCHGHPLRPEWVADLPSAELAAIHRRLHGRAVEPDPSLVDVRLIELWTDPAARQTTGIPLESAIRDEDPLVWLPLRIADLVHHSDAPGHSDTSGCRACADVIDATIRALIELDTTPHQIIENLETDNAGLRATVDALVGALALAPGALLAIARWAALVDLGPGDHTGEVVDYDHEAVDTARVEAEEQLNLFLDHALRAGEHLPMP